MSRIFKSETHAQQLVEKVSALLEGRRRYSDVQVEVCGKVFYCHKLILALQSKYFDQKFYPQTSTEVGGTGKFVVENVGPEEFQYFLCFIYRGEIELNCQNLAGVVRAADVLCVNELKKMCAQYILETLYVRNCVRYWRLAERTGVDEAIDACKKLFLEEFAKVVSTCELSEMTETMMEAALSDDNLRIAREEDIVGMFVKWLDVQSRRKPFQSCQLFYHVRWSGVSAEYIKSKLMNNPNIIGNCQCVKFLSNVLTYRHTGMQFDGLKTFHRPSTGIEQCVVVIGINTGDKISSEMFRVSMQSRCVVARLQDVPCKMEMEAAACVSSNVLFVTGIGPKCRNVWRWDPLSGWGRCGDLIEGRRRHCAAVIGSASMYVLGGYVDDADKILCSVEHYSFVTNKWMKVGDLAHPTECAACVSYKTFAYLFGGSSREPETNIEIDLDCVQVFDTATKTCSVLCRSLPQPERLLKAVCWQNSAILLNCRACIIFDLDQQTFQQRDAQYAAGVSHFGLVLENQTIFILGGRISQSQCSYDKDQTQDEGKDKGKGKDKDKDKEKDKGKGKGKGKENLACPKPEKEGKDGKPKDPKQAPCCDTVKTMSITDLVENCPAAKWIPHAKLPMPCLVQACAVLTLPLCPNPDEGKEGKGKKKDKDEKSEPDKPPPKAKAEKPRKDAERDCYRDECK